MPFSVPCAVPVEVRASNGRDAAHPVDRCWRLSRSIGEETIRFARDLPYEPGRPVEVELTLPGDEAGPMTAMGIVLGIPPDDEEAEGEAARPRAITFTSVDENAKKRLAHYVAERMQSP